MVEKWKRKRIKRMWASGREAELDWMLQVRNKLMRVAGDATWDHSMVLAYALTRGHISVHGNSVVSVC